MKVNITLKISIYIGGIYIYILPSLLCFFFLFKLLCVIFICWLLWVFSSVPGWWPHAVLGCTCPLMVGWQWTRFGHGLLVLPDVATSVLFSFLARSVSKYQYKALHLNILSLPCKFEALRNILYTFNETGIKFDCIIICESFLRDNNSNLYYLNGYNFICTHRQFSNGGGACMYINSDIQYKIWDDLTIFHEGEFETIFIETIHNPTMVGEIYRAPNTGIKSSLNHYESPMSKLTGNKSLIIGIDQNFDCLKIEINNNTSELLNTYLSSSIIQTIKKPTESVTHLIQVLETINWNYLKSYSIEDAYNDFISKLNELMDMDIQKKRVTIPARYITRDPWMSKGLMTSSRTSANYIINVWYNHAYLNYSKSELVTVYNTLKRTAKINYYSQLFKDYKFDIRNTLDY